VVRGKKNENPVFYACFFRPAVSKLNVPAHCLAGVPEFPLLENTSRRVFCRFLRDHLALGA
jgi:hypothetical protein